MNPFLPSRWLWLPLKLFHLFYHQVIVFPTLRLLCSDDILHVQVWYSVVILLNILSYLAHSQNHHLPLLPYLLTTCMGISTCTAYLWIIDHFILPCSLGNYIVAKFSSRDCHFGFEFFLHILYLTPAAQTFLIHVYSGQCLWYPRWR